MNIIEHMNIRSKMVCKISTLTYGIDRLAVSSDHAHYH